jgi:hypothetical protein
LQVTARSQAHVDYVGTIVYRPLDALYYVAQEATAVLVQYLDGLQVGAWRYTDNAYGVVARCGDSGYMCSVAVVVIAASTLGAIGTFCTIDARDHIQVGVVQINSGIYYSYIYACAGVSGPSQVRVYSVHAPFQGLGRLCGAAIVTAISVARSAAVSVSVVNRVQLYIRLDVFHIGQAAYIVYRRFIWQNHNSAVDQIQFLYILAAFIFQGLAGLFVNRVIKGDDYPLGL